MGHGTAWHSAVRNDMAQHCTTRHGSGMARHDMTRYRTRHDMGHDMAWCGTARHDTGHGTAAAWHGVPQITDIIHMYVCMCVTDLVALLLFPDHVTVINLIQFFIVFLTSCAHVQCLHTQQHIHTSATVDQPFTHTSESSWQNKLRYNCTLTWSMSRGSVWTGIGCHGSVSLHTWEPCGGNSPARLQ